MDGDFRNFLLIFSDLSVAIRNQAASLILPSRLYLKVFGRGARKMTEFARRPARPEAA